jgi:gamma-glutamyltranspeptidase / glutathione hydrolase
MGPPSSGAIAIQQILATIEPVDMAALGPGPEAVHWMSEAGRLAFADRARYLGDPDFVNVPVRGLLDRGYLRDRAALVDPSRSMGEAEAGDPPFRQGALSAPSDGIENGTSHISVVDGDGNAVSMTTTIESGFGARLMTEGGFLLNNELTDFAFAPEEEGRAVANRVEPGKRPRSSMSPTFVLDRDRKLFAALGSAGGARIIGDTLQTVIGLLDWNMSMQEAIAQPRIINTNGATELEAGTPIAAQADALRALGDEVQVRRHDGGLTGVRRAGDGWQGGADPRRDGVALGE